jgi:hypothetical protein
MEGNLMTEKQNYLERIANPLEAITDLSHPDELAEAYSNARGLIKKVEELLVDMKAEFESQMLAIIDVRGPVQIGHDKLVRGVKKSAKQADAMIILKDLLKATNGNTEHIANCIASAGFKKGEVEKILGDKCPHFWSVDSDVMKKSVLKSYNVKFLTEKK